MLKSRICLILLGLIITCCNLTTYGSNAVKNNDAPLVITADSFTLDYANGYAVYTDHVAVNQSNRQLKSDNLFIYFDKKADNSSTQKDNKFKSIIATTKDLNNPVVFLERNINDSNSISLVATAGIIKYEPGVNTNKLTLEKNAIIQQNNKKLISELLYYDLKNEIAYMPKVKNQRSKIILG